MPYACGGLSGPLQALFTRTFLEVPVPGSLLSALTTVLVALVQPKIDLRRLTQGFDLASQLLDLLESVRQNLNLQLAGAPHG